MHTNLEIEPALINDALQIGGLKTKKATVDVALREFIQRRRAESLIGTFGTIDFDIAHDYKKARAARPKRHY